MEFLNFKGHQFTILQDKKGNPWWVAKELCDYLERGRDTLLRQVGRLTGKWQFFKMVIDKYSVYVSQTPGNAAGCKYIARLSEKAKNGDFTNFACNNINNLQTPI